MIRTHSIRCFVVFSALLAMETSSSAVSIRSNAQATINLPTGIKDDCQSGVAYHPGFQQYYAAKIADDTDLAYVWNASGTIQQSTSAGVDFRTPYYNPNTSKLEVVSFNAKNNTTNLARGLMTMGLDTNGKYTGTNTQTLSTMPGLADINVMPAYDPLNNHFYSRTTTGTVSITKRSNGSANGTFNLDLTTPGSNTLVSNFIGYDKDLNVLITIDHVNKRALVHETDGDYLGASALPNSLAINSEYSAGYANGQLFVLDLDTDTDTHVYRGMTIFVPEPSSGFLAVCGFWGLLFYARRRHHLQTT